MERRSTTRPRPGRRNGPASIAALVAAALVIGLLGRAAQAATLSVNCDTGGDLQAKIQAASNGSTILVKGTCAGNFTITGKALTIKGNPTATLDGVDVFRPLGINSPGKVVHLVGLTVTGGVAQFGAGILSLADGLTLNRVTVRDNLATSSSAPATGGGIFSAGNLTLTDSTVSGNRARTTDSGGEADGGGIATSGGDLAITDSKVTGNRATADLASGDADAAGGGIFVSSGELTMKGTTVAANRVVASSPGPVSAIGGGIYSEFGPATDSVNGSVITGNAATAIAPGGQATAAGGGVHETFVHMTASSVSNNLATASGSSVLVQGGGLGAEGATLARSTVRGNRARGASTSSDANTQGGGIAVDSVAITASTISRNTAVATTTGSAEANADGGGVRTSEVAVTNSTIAFNKAAATSSGSAPSSAAGGGLFAAANSSVIDSTIAGNAASASGSAASAEGGGLSAAELDFEATIVANNTATTGPDCFGGPTSDGNNLVRKPVGCSFTKKPSDIVAKDPKLGPLQGNGGPTQTMAIALASPARDAIPQPACAVATDQRGVHRPQGLKCDIGAYERKVT